MVVVIIMLVCFCGIVKASDVELETKVKLNTKDDYIKTINRFNEICKYDIDLFEFYNASNMNVGDYFIKVYYHTQWCYVVGRAITHVRVSKGFIADDETERLYAINNIGWIARQEEFCKGETFCDGWWEKAIE